MLKLAKKSLKKHESEAERMIREWNEEDDARHRAFVRKYRTVFPWLCALDRATRGQSNPQENAAAVERQKIARRAAVDSMVESCRRAYKAGEPIEHFFAGFLRATDTRVLIFKLREERVAYAILLDLRDQQKAISDQHALWERCTLETDQAQKAWARRFGPTF